jgi:D-alanine-D-alanine ligase
MAAHVAVLMGGLSAERPVSLRSGAACAASLERQGFTVSRVDVGHNVAADLAALKPDVALVVLHGRYGEDGIVQGLLEMMAIPYSHSGVYSSAVAMKKDTAKLIMKEAGVPVAQGITASRFEAAKAHLMAPPYVIKPVAEGSSFGVFLVTEEHAHPPQELTREDWTHGEEMLVEKFIPGQELTCAVIRDQATDVIEVVPKVGFYDYEAKYAPGGSKHELPAQILPKVYQLVRRLTLTAHRALGCRGVSRADFRYDARAGEAGGLFCLEVNTQPGMTETSLVPELAAFAGISFDELVRWMVEDASLNR